VRRCPKLGSLSVAKPKAAAVVRCAAEWWAGLDWVDNAAKTSFKPVFYRKTRMMPVRCYREEKNYSYFAMCRKNVRNIIF
jgi:ribosomal protein S14